MGIEMMLGLTIGILFIFGGYIVRTKQIFIFLAGFGQTWEPVNKERLGNRVGMLLMLVSLV